MTDKEQAKIDEWLAKMGDCPSPNQSECVLIVPRNAPQEAIDLFGGYFWGMKIVRDERIPDLKT